MSYTEIEKDIPTETVINGDIENPFSTKDIKITNVTMSLSSLISRLKYDEIDLNPDFQRNSDLWKNKKMSRLIESILLRLPLPTFYFDVSNPDKWIVVDGLQRLSTLKRFVIDGKLILNELEFLTKLNGQNYNELDRSLLRIIDDTQIITYQIEAQTPKKVRYSIFNRINTGGLALNAQEVRQALNQEEKGVKFLKEICENKEFKEIVNLKSVRMLDRELVLRFIAFKLTNYKDFNFNYLSDFLDEAMEKLDAIQDETILNNYKNDLIETLKFSEEILGKKHRFSRSIAIGNKTKSLNRSLFDVITVCFSNIKDKSKFLNKKEIFLDRFRLLLIDEKSDFSKSITEGTSGKKAIENRFKIMDNLIVEVLDEN